MTSEQVETEKDLLDSRIKEHPILLGYQDWQTVPRFLQERRAKNTFYLPRRGLVRGFGRESMNEKVDMDPDEWPEADLTDTFPSLEGKDLWRTYKEVDREKKVQRMQTDNEEQDKIDRLKEVADELQEEGLEKVITRHPQNKVPYVDADLVEIEKGLSQRKAKKVKKILERRVDDLEQHVDADA